VNMNIIYMYNMRVLNVLCTYVYDYPVRNSAHAYEYQ